MYALSDGDYSRVTTDIDLLALRISNDSQKLNTIFEEIFSIECDDALVYDINSLQIKTITQLKEYQGVNISIKVFLGKTLIPISIDIGFDDVIYPEKIEMDFPTLLNNEIPNIYVYSIYTVIAEKFEAIVSLGLSNSRYKDFYDIYSLATNYNIDGRTLKSALIETFNHRNTLFDSIVAFSDDYVNDSTNKQRWNSFVRKKKVVNIVNFEETIYLIKKLLLPIVDSIINKKDYDKKWSKDSKSWM